MTPLSFGRRQASDGARKAMRTAALERGEREAAAIVERVRSAIRLIQEETTQNSGVYPYNNGTLSAAEVARRGRVAVTTLHKTRYRALLGEIKAWLGEQQSKSAVRRVGARKTLSERVEEWRSLYNDLADVHRVTEIELHQAQESLREARQEIAELQLENERLRALRAQLAGDKVVSLHPRAP